ncbi:MAG: Lpg1974 family pore-forming outer membrane protein [Gemmatales bacterium]
MIRLLSALFLLLLGTTPCLLAQAPGMPLVAAASSSPRFWLDGDVEWASPRVNGNDLSRRYDSTFIPQITFGWNIADDQAMIASYRYLGADTSAAYHVGIPDAESEDWRHLRLQTLDLMYRERMGGVGAPLGMDVDMGSRFVYTKFNDQILANTIGGPFDQQREQSAFLMGPRMGIRPYWMFDQSEWQMTIYGRLNGSYLWGTFRSRESVNGSPTVYDNTYSSLWNYDAEAGLSFCIPGTDGALQLSGGYRYEYWSSSRFGFITGGDTGNVTTQGPFIRLQFAF